MAECLCFSTESNLPSQLLPIEYNCTFLHLHLPYAKVAALKKKTDAGIRAGIVQHRTWRKRAAMIIFTATRRAV